MTVPQPLDPPGRPSAWAGPLVELERVEWRRGDAADPAALLRDLLTAHGLGGEPAGQRGDTGVALLLGADACAALGDVPAGCATPAPGVPDLVAVAVRRSDDPSHVPGRAGRVGPWTTSWSDAAHARAVEAVREAIGRGDVYQANVVGHRSAPLTGDPGPLAAAVAVLPRASYGGVLGGAGWTVASASPEQLVRLDGDRLTTVPIKGTSRDREALAASAKDRAEHVMIVDLERNDLSRVAVPGSVVVERLYDLAPWSDLWHASSVVAARLAPGRDVVDVLQVLAPGGSVTGAPKRAACGVLAGLEPVGRGPSMGAFGFVRPGGLDLGLTIRTVAFADGRAHLWAGGGITWGSDPAAEVAEAHAKAGPVLAALERAGS